MPLGFGGQHQLRFSCKLNFLINDFSFSLTLFVIKTNLFKVTGFNAVFGNDIFGEGKLFGLHIPVAGKPHLVFRHGVSDPEFFSRSGDGILNYLSLLQTLGSGDNFQEGLPSPSYTFCIQFCFRFR